MVRVKNKYFFRDNGRFSSIFILGGHRFTSILSMTTCVQLAKTFLVKKSSQILTLPLEYKTNPDGTVFCLLGRGAADLNLN